MTKRKRIVVHGRVQGVGFRAYTQDTAARLRLTGYVMNRPDRTVEIVAEGESDALDKLVAWCHHGPSMAHVERVTVEDERSTGEWTAFQVTG
jgi:acylphosphatase